MSPPERRALLLLLALAVAGQGIRHLATRPGEPPGQVQLLTALPPGSPTAQRDSARLHARPLAPGELIDADVAPAAELARLPRVGLRLAKTIIADREAHGAFGSLEGLDRVSGVGPGLLKVLGAHVRFTGICRKGACVARPVPPDGAGPVGLASADPTHLNSATLADLEALPGIGPAKAAAILQYREQNGPFSAIEDLARVPGFGAAAVAKLRNRVSIH
jgi:comEA protein